MKLPFKKSKSKEEFKAPTLQDHQNQFNQTMFELGISVYKKFVANQAISELASESNTLCQKAMQINKDADKLKQKMQAEVTAKIEEDKASKEVSSAEKAS
jgi:hypothetical protein